MTEDRERLEQQRDRALRDLLDLERQVDDGEITSDVAEDLRVRYERAVATALDGLAAVEQSSGEESAPAAAGPRSRARWAVYGLALAAAVFAAVVLLPGYVGERPAGGAVTGNEALGAPGAEGGDGTPRDLSTVSNAEMEQVVAENPGIVGMRLALAHRYLDEADDLAAIRHYLVALSQEPRNVEARSHYAWLLLQIGEADQAMEEVDRALAQDPRHLESLWFKANIALYGLSDPATALAVVDRLRQLPDLPAEVRSQADALAGEAEDRAASG